MLTSKDQILGACSREPKEVFVPDFNDSVLLAPMSAAERDAFEASMLDTKGNAKKLQNFRARFVARCIVDEDGNRLFSDNDIIELGKMNAKPVSFLFDQCRDLCGMSEEAVQELEGE